MINKIVNKRSSIIIILLLLFIKSGFSLPLTRTIYTIPEESIEFSINEEFSHNSDTYRIDQFILGLGLLTDFSVWLKFKNMNENYISRGKKEIGDSFVDLKYFLGNYRHIFYYAFLMNFRFPSSPNGYYNKDWNRISSGVNELEWGGSGVLNLKNLFLHFNLLYVFREEKDQGFYNKIYLNPLKGVTYKTVLGLNSFSEKSFLYMDNLKNDYFKLSFALNTDFIKPLIPYIEFSIIRRFYTGDIDNTLPYVPCNANPLLVAGGIRYFYQKDIFIGIYSLVNPISIEEKIYFITGLEFSLQF